VGSAGVTHDEDLGEVDHQARVEVVVQEHSTQIFLNQKPIEQNKLFKFI